MEKVNDSIKAVRETLEKAGLGPQDVERIVFVGGPTNYKPLRDHVGFELGLPASTEINPMTAVAEGAAIFAESIDWESQSRHRKTNRGTLASTGPLNVRFNYTARTPSGGRIIAQADDDVPPGTEFQVDNLDSGWNSGRMALTHNTEVNLPLSRTGENRFTVAVFDGSGRPCALEQNTIAITRTAAMVEAIPASHSIGVEVRETLGGRPSVDWLVRANDELPKKGTRIFKAGESLKAGSNGSLNFRLLEGESDEPEYNRLIGMLKVTGADFDDGAIYAGADLQCEYEMLDSGAIVLEVSVPSIGATFDSHNYYSRQEGQHDFSADGERVKERAEETLQRLDEIDERINDPRIERARRKLERAIALEPGSAESERVQEAMDGVEEARRSLAEVRKSNLKEIRQIELDEVESLFSDHLQKFAHPSEKKTFSNLVRTTQRAIDRNDNDFEGHMSALRETSFGILWRQDWFVVQRFQSMATAPHWFADQSRFETLVERGRAHLESDDMAALRQIVVELHQIQIQHVSHTDTLDVSNIIRS